MVKGARLESDFSYYYAEMVFSFDTLVKGACCLKTFLVQQEKRDRVSSWICTPPSTPEQEIKTEF